MNQPQERPKDHLTAAKKEVKEAAQLITDSVKNSADEKIEHVKDKIKDAVDKIHDTDTISKQ